MPALSGFSRKCTDLIDSLGILKCGKIARIIANLGGPDNAAHDLGIARLGQGGDEMYPGRCEGLSHILRN
jgi:hypothetical protein